jgi:nucleotide-binding universal stress UspA family protein
MYERILIATDGSKHSEKAAERAIEIAKLSGGKVIVLFVADPGKYYFPAEEAMMSSRSYEMSGDKVKVLQDAMMKDAEEATKYATEKAKLAGATLEKRIVKGHPAEEILKAAEDVDLVVMGSLGRTGMGRFLLGSVTERVIQNSKTPVLVVY